jgi:hypothetical protein
MQATLHVGTDREVKKPSDLKFAWLNYINYKKRINSKKFAIESTQRSRAKHEKPICTDFVVMSISEKGEVP